MFLFYFFLTNPLWTCKIIIVIMYSPVIFKCKFVTEFLFLFLVLYTGSELWDTGNNGWFFWVVTGCHVTARDVWTIHLFFSIALSPSLFQRTGFLIFLFFFVIFFLLCFLTSSSSSFCSQGKREPHWKTCCVNGNWEMP